MIKINSLDNDELNIYSKLTEKELLHINEPHDGIFIAESPKVILRALDAGYEPISILSLDPDISKEPLVDKVLKRCENIPIYIGSESILRELTGFNLTRGMLCAMKRKANPSAVSICSSSKRLAVLEAVVNPTNLGAIIRSAAALNIDGIIFTHDCADPLYRRCIRVSMGNVFLVPWTILPDTDLIDFLHNQNFKTVAMALEDRSVTINELKFDKDEKIAILLGNEGTGLKNESIQKSDYIVKIPMANGVDSLNVAAASALAFWELCEH